MRMVTGPATWLFLGLSSTTVPASAFCIYNARTSTKPVHIRQTAGGQTEHSASVAPGKRSCCDWKSPRCNVSTRSGSEVELSIMTLDGFLRRCHIKMSADTSIITIADSTQLDCREKVEAPPTPSVRPKPRRRKAPRSKRRAHLRAERSAVQASSRRQPRRRSPGRKS